MSVSANACPRNHLYLLSQKPRPKRRGFSLVRPEAPSQCSND
jgi:hypothetical protein